MESRECFSRNLKWCDRIWRNVKCCDKRGLWVGLQWVSLQFVGGFVCDFGVVVLVKYV